MKSLTAYFQLAFVAIVVVLGGCGPASSPKEHAGSAVHSLLAQKGKISVGMTRSDVLAAIGPPVLVQTHNGWESLIYQVSPEDPSARSSEPVWVGFEIFLQGDKVVMVKDITGHTH